MKRIKIVNYLLIGYLTLAGLLAIGFTFKKAFTPLPDTRMEQFLDCSKDQGDSGCDSCYFAIYGYYINPFTGEKIK
jgi:hypothetical protein